MRRLSSGFLRIFVLALLAPAARAAVYTVTNVNDSGSGSLRQAIVNANAGSGADTIRFSIPGSGVHTIVPTSALPTITSPVTIDGTGQTIEISGANAPDGTDALRVTGGGSTIRNLTINRFRPLLFGGGGDAIVLSAGGGNGVFGCRIGTNPAGTAKLSNGGNGIAIEDSANNVIGGDGAAQRNIIAGGFVGVFVEGAGSTGNLVQGNRIGLGNALAGGFGTAGDGVVVREGIGNQILGNLIGDNTGNGIVVSTGAAGNLIQSNVIGVETGPGSEPLGNGGEGIQVNGASQNTIAGNQIIWNGRNGILIFNHASGNLVVGNFVGTNAAGTANLGNAVTGILVTEGDDNQIGGVSPADRNFICGNGANGIRLRSGSSGNTLRGNFVGVGPGGAPDGNGDDGIEINDGAHDNVVGGKSAGAGNVVSGNAANGVRIADAATAGNIVQGNWIGSDASGATALANAAHGVLIENGAHDNRIGGAAAGAGNTIAFNGGSGVFIESGAGNAILVNLIRGNAGLGIDLAPEGVTANDAGDADPGANQLQNFPEVVAAASSGGTTAVDGGLHGLPATTFRIEFFASVLCDASGHGEGRFFLGETDVVTDAAGAAFFHLSLPVAARGPFIAATATDPAGNTSEFSACLKVPGPTVSAVFPPSGPAAGGMEVIVTGSSFQAGATALFGGIAGAGAVTGGTSEIAVTTPALSPGTLNDVTAVNPNSLSGTRPKAWLADFSDVPSDHLYHRAVEKMFRADITSGCGSGNYCPDASVNRASMAVFLLRGEHGGAHEPPGAKGDVFADVTLGTFLAAWIEELAAEEITTGCGQGNYCPEAPVTRAGMAVFLLRAKHGADYHPPVAAGDVFDDVPPGTFLGDWIEQLAAESITTGCAAKLFCPDQPVTRGEMAVFLVRTFGL